MSKPKPPYYYKINGSDTYHWEKKCSNNHWEEGSTEWKKSDKQPSGREQCNQCKTIK